MKCDVMLITGSVCVSQAECDLEKGLEMRKWVLSGILASEETYLGHLEALLLVRTRTHSCDDIMCPLRSCVL